MFYVCFITFLILVLFHGLFILVFDLNVLGFSASRYIFLCNVQINCIRYSALTLQADLMVLLFFVHVVVAILPILVTRGRVLLQRGEEC